MLEAEITPAGDVLVEGQHVGMLQGFRFTPDPQAEGADAQGAARRPRRRRWPTAIAERAERLRHAPRSGHRARPPTATLRWQGEPIARLIAGDDALKPRFVLLADEQLSGPPRDRVEAPHRPPGSTAHIDTLLKPLVDLAADPALTGMARGIAFRLVENLGVARPRATSPRRFAASTRTPAPACAGTASASAPTTSTCPRC